MIVDVVNVCSTGLFKATFKLNHLKSYWSFALLLLLWMCIFCVALSCRFGPMNRMNSRIKSHTKWSLAVANGEGKKGPHVETVFYSSSSKYIPNQSNAFVHSIFFSFVRSLVGLLLFSLNLLLACILLFCCRHFKKWAVTQFWSTESFFFINSEKGHIINSFVPLSQEGSQYIVLVEVFFFALPLLFIRLANLRKFASSWFRAIRTRNYLFDSTFP